MAVLHSAFVTIKWGRLESWGLRKKIKQYYFGVEMLKCHLFPSRVCTVPNIKANNETSARESKYLLLLKLVHPVSPQISDTCHLLGSLPQDELQWELFQFCKFLPWGFCLVYGGEAEGGNHPAAWPLLRLWPYPAYRDDSVSKMMYRGWGVAQLLDTLRESGFCYRQETDSSAG